MMPAWPGFGTDQDDSIAHPVYRGQLRIAITSAIGTGELSYRLTHGVGRDNASVRERGGRRRSSQTPGCNGQDRVKVRQGKLSKRIVNRCSEESR